jgi:hypothetical protein
MDEALCLPYVEGDWSWQGRVSGMDVFLDTISWFITYLAVSQSSLPACYSRKELETSLASLTVIFLVLGSLSISSTVLLLTALSSPQRTFATLCKAGGKSFSFMTFIPYG